MDRLPRTSFKKTEQSTHSHELSKVLDKSRAKRNQTEPENEEWDPPARTNSFQEDVAGYFDNAVDDIEDGQSPVELISHKIEISPETLNSSITTRHISMQELTLTLQRFTYPMFDLSRKQSR